MSRRQHGEPLSKEEAKAQLQCRQCMGVALAEVAKLIETAKPELTRDEAAAIVRAWAETRSRGAW